MTPQNFGSIVGSIILKASDDVNTASQVYFDVMEFCPWDQLRQLRSAPESPFCF